MIKAKDAIAVARSYIGTPYSEMDCIRLIVMVIRNSPGGIKDYRCQGTNWLWDSVNKSGKYRHLTSREEGLSGAQAGKLAFKRYGEGAEDHVGIVTGEGTIIHSSSVNGRGVVETPLSISEGWDLLGVHRYIQVEDSVAESEETSVEAYKMQVRLKNPDEPDNYLSVRKGPSTKHDIVGRLAHGAIVMVQAESNGWAFVTYGETSSGYVKAEYLALPEVEENVITVGSDVTIIDSDGNTFKPVGDFRVLRGSVD